MDPARDLDFGPLPLAIGGYEVLRELNPDQSYLTLAPGGRRVVCKRVDPDCLIQDGAKLHPSIRDRLARVRELAHARVANLHGVERDPAWQGGAAYLVWEFVDGEPLDAWAARPDVTDRDVIAACRELLLTVESLHARGIVHGAVHARNVIVDAAGKLRLTHVSPLLYTEPQNDLDALAYLFADLAERRAGASDPLSRLSHHAGSGGATLRTLAAEAATLLEAPVDADDDRDGHAADLRRRRRSRVAAALVVGVALVGVWQLKRVAVARWGELPPSPPQAAPAAMGP